LGVAHSAFKPNGEGMDNLRLKGASVESLGDRKRLLTSFDTLRRDLDATGSMWALATITEKALGVLTSSKLLEALDLSREPAKVRERYGDGKPYKFQLIALPTVNDQLLMARRLVEAGVRCVTLGYGSWDNHEKNFEIVRDHGSKLDQCLSALVEDLEVRGM